MNGELVAYIACEVLYLAVCLYTGNEYVQIGNPDDYMNDSISFKGARSVNYLKKVHPESYAYLAAAIRMLGDEVEDMVYFYENF